MKAIDHVQPFIPTNRVQKPGGKGARRDPGTGKRKPSPTKIRSEHKSNRDKHVVDEFA